MTDLWCPFAVQKPFPWWKQAPVIQTTGLVLHTAVSNSDSLWGMWAGKPNGTGATGYVRKDGTIEEYLPVNRRANAQYHGNSFASSLESWDGGHPETTPWTAEQVAAIVRWGKWQCSVTATPAVQCRSQSGPGIGWHCMWGVPDHRPNGWNWDGHTCPGTPRIGQMGGIIAAIASDIRPPGKGQTLVIYAATDKATNVQGLYLVYQGNGETPIAVHLRTDDDVKAALFFGATQHLGPDGNYSDATALLRLVPGAPPIV